MDEFETVLQQVQDKLPAITAWSYIGIWAFSEMILRMRQNPESPRFAEIRFPHTSVPLFSEEEAAKLEEELRKAHTGLNAVMKQQGGSQEEDIDSLPSVIPQRGGKVPFPPTFKDFSKASHFAGDAIGMVVAGADPELFSLNRHYETITKTLDSLDAQVTDLSKQYGVTAIESVAPDPKFTIPLGPIPIPIIIPVRTIMPAVTIFLELLRVISSIYPITSFIVKPVSFLMVLLDLAKGNLYHAMFSFIGIFGKYPLYAGILLKFLRDIYLFISPDIRTDIRDVIFKSGKSFIVGAVVWFFTVVSPEIVRKPIVMLLDKVRTVAENFNDTMTKAEVKATAAMKGFGSVELPKLPSDKIPSIGDLYILQEYIHNPRLYCHPDVSPIIQEMRAIPPLALFFDLLNIPTTTSMEYAQKCAEVESVPLVDSFAPKITLMDPTTGQPLPNLPIPAKPGAVPAVAV